MSEALSVATVTYGDGPLGWQDRGVCRGSEVPFILEGNQRSREAKKLCNTPCPVKKRCLDYAIDNDIPDGIWGGQTRGERKLTKALSEASKAALQGAETQP